MKLFIGLWNPGVQYEKTRHNAWFIALEDFCNRYNATDLLYNKKFQAEVATGIFGTTQFIAVKPMTYMNKSWWPVQAIMQFYKIAPEDCLIIHDDIDIPSWTIKLKYSWSHWWHNWIKDIYAKSWSTNFWKLKLWVGRPDHPSHDVVDYVLWNFSAEEIHTLHTSDHEIDQRIEQYCKNVG